MAIAEVVDALPLDREEQKIEELCSTARNLLSEEALRCALLLAKLNRLGSSREDKERVREVYQQLVSRHLLMGAPFPVDMTIPGEKEQVIRALEVMWSRLAYHVLLCSSSL
jgi:hypothetical protein